MLHPATQLGFVNETIGFGVFATRLIPKGTITWALDELDQSISESCLNSLEPVQRTSIVKYAYRNREGQYILCWDLGRFMNHSFQPNCISTAYEFDLATRDIYPGEELTCDYGCLNVDEPFHGLPEAGCEREWVLPDDLLRYYQEWDQVALDALQQFEQVEQPLRSFLSAQTRESIPRVIAGTLPLESVLQCYYDRAPFRFPVQLPEVMTLGCQETCRRR